MANLESTIHYSLFTIHYSPFTIHHSPLTTHYSPFTFHYSPLTIHHSRLTIHHSPFTIHHSPFTIHHSPFTIHHSLFTIPHSPLTTHHSPLPLDTPDTIFPGKPTDPPDQASLLIKTMQPPTPTKNHRPGTKKRTYVRATGGEEDALVHDLVLSNVVDRRRSLVTNRPGFCILARFSDTLDSRLRA